jgi:hydroxymethylpyrimidine kinase/phosphomethylpyrimidine kinase
MVSTSGAQLLPQDAVSTLIERLLPLSTVLTPNILEAKLLLGREDQPDPSSKDEMMQMAQDLCKLGPEYVLLKGGHLKPRGSKEDMRSIVDVLHGNGKNAVFEKPYIESNNTHGTGCSLACERLARYLYHEANDFPSRNSFEHSVWRRGD